MITCRQCDDFLDDYLDGTLAWDKKEVFEQHLSYCPPCVQYVEAYRQSSSLARAASPSVAQESEAMPEDLINAILAAQKKHP